MKFLVLFEILLWYRVLCFSNYSRNVFEALIEEKVSKFEKEEVLIRSQHHRHHSGHHHQPSVTIFFPYYNQYEALQFQLVHYASFPAHLKDRITVFVVDDGSQNFKAFDYITPDLMKKLNITLYRIDIDVYWNTVETNNIAFDNSNTDYLLRMDIDSFIDAENLEALLNLHDRNHAYLMRYKSFKHNTFIDHVHPNAFFLPWKIYHFYRYNEYFSGNYGYEDTDFSALLKSKGRVKVLNDIFFWVRNEQFSSAGVNRRNVTINDQKRKDPNRPFYVHAHRDYYLLQILHSVVVKKKTV